MTSCAAWSGWRPLFVVGGSIGWGSTAPSPPFALALVAANFAAAAALIGWAARTSPTALMVAVLGGYIVRLGAVLARRLAGPGPAVGRDGAARHHPARHPPRPPRLGDPLRLASLAFPGLKPGTDTEDSCS